LIYTSGNFTDLNFLAHQYLSFDVEPLMVGNFLADTLKGKERDLLPKDVYKGVEIHHLIDNFTDSHPLVLETRKILYPYFNKYAAVVQDVYFDHFLAKNWKNYSTEPLLDFTQRVYRVLGERIDLFNQRAERTYYYMSTQNWLLNYSKTEGLDRALTGLSRRASFQNNMDQSIEPLLKHQEELIDLFSSFFPMLEAEVREKFSDLVK
jgi:acyl carrier protein phosphodiesterase